MITRLKKIDSVATHYINQPMFLCNSSGPPVAQLVLERRRLTNALKWIFENILNQQQNSESRFSLSLHSPAQVLSKLRLEYCLPFRWCAQDPVLDGVA